MERIHSFSMEGQEDLRIVEHLDMQKLPESIQQMLSLASTPEEQDIILMATLAAASACVPNLFFTYGPTGKKYYANLQCFILAAAASGKGIANQALEMVRVIDEQYPMLIAGDSTLPAWYKALEEQGGCGYMHESEGSVITDIWKSSAANYNTALRKAAEHEAISRNRCKGASEIKCPKLSMLLTAMRGDSSLTSRAQDKEMPEYNSDSMNETLLCMDEDYETAEMIGNKLLLHMASAYRMIDGDAQDVVPEIKPLDQRKVLFEQLRPEYKLQELISEAKSQGVSRRSAIRWNDNWQDNGMVLKTEYGHYKKVG